MEQNLIDDWLNPNHKGQVKMRELPITLPSLSVAKVTVPERMTELDFNIFVETIKGWKPALVPKQNPNTTEDDPDGE